MTRHTALIGVGYWGKNLARNLDALNALHTICDIEAHTLQRARPLYPQVQFTRDISAIFQNPEIHSVVIATPAASHYELAKQALQAGKDVYVEKPLCLKVSDGEELIAMARDENRILMVGHILQYHPCVEKLQTLVADGTLGELQYISSHRLNLGKICTVESALFSYAPHDISMILSLTNELPHEVRCTGGTFLKPGVADTTLTTLTFSGKLKAHVYVSWLNPFKEQRLSIVGSKAMVVFDDTKPWEEKLTLFRDYLPGEKLNPEPIPTEKNEPLREECAHFLRCCETREQPLTGGERALRVLRVLQAAQESLLEDGERKQPATYLAHTKLVHL